MKNYIVGAAVAASVAVVVSACSGNSPQDECNKLADTYCSKLYQCLDATLVQKALGYTSQSDCQAKEKVALSCASNSGCPTGKVYYPDKADACINDYNNATCAELTGSFSSANCSQVCQ